MAHAHSYVIETFADFGLIGIAVSRWPCSSSGEAAVRRTLAPWREGVTHTAERTGLITMLAVVVIFGVSSAIDWTWFVPGVTVPALVCAGWLAARGPLREADRRKAEPVPGQRARPLPLGRIATAIGVVAAVLIAGWFVWQPLHSSDQVSAAITDVTRGDAPAALAAAHDAADSDPCRSTRSLSCRRSTRRWATRPRAAPSSSRRPRSSRPTRRPGSRSARSISRPIARNRP